MNDNCTSQDHHYWMQEALKLAYKAEQSGEVPVGALIIKNNQLIGEGWNQSIQQNDPSAHAEIQAIRAACNHQQNYRLPGSTLYVTLEPCSMCAGAIVHARISCVVFAAHDPRTGAAESVFSILNHDALNHRCEIISGVCAEQSSTLLKTFFRAKRKG